jgi:hypothetical protein
VVEHRTFNPRVEGSSPSTSTNKKRKDQANEKTAMMILEEEYPENYETVMDWGMDCEVDNAFEYYIKEGFTEEEALIEALSDWDLL